METKMSKKDQAKDLFKQGYSCSQAVAAVFAKDHGLPFDTALKLAQGFGGGMARLAETCGAVTGAIIVIGLKHGRTRTEDEAAKERTYALVQELVRRFRARHGALDCRDLLGCDIGTPEGRKLAAEGKLHDKLCPLLVVSAVEILEDIL
jgi:C_GCAxxG_C_C family probable redox protein